MYMVGFFAMNSLMKMYFFTILLQQTNQQALSHFGLCPKIHFCDEFGKNKNGKNYETTPSLLNTADCLRAILSNGSRKELGYIK